jgi:hypothetical protein
MKKKNHQKDVIIVKVLQCAIESNCCNNKSHIISLQLSYYYIAHTR